MHLQRKRWIAKINWEKHPELNVYDVDLTTKSACQVTLESKQFVLIRGNWVTNEHWTSTFVVSPTLGRATVVVASYQCTRHIYSVTCGDPALSSR